MKSKLSILGLYDYNNDIFSGLQLPSPMSRSILIDYIMMECADLELLYPNYDIMQRMISSWSIARLHSWDRLFQSTVQEYNMIHNYDRHEDWSETGNRDNNINSEASGTGSKSGSGKQLTKQPGYNTAAGMVTTQEVDTNTSENAQQSNVSYVKDSENHINTRNGHLYGNIGVTTAAQMLTEERELDKWDVYQAITQEFKYKFCVLVY